MPDAPHRPVLVELARALARDIDDQNWISAHPALSRELRATLAELHKGGARSGGRLALVSQKSAPRQTRNSPGSKPIA